MNNHETFGGRLAKLMAARMVVGAIFGVGTFTCASGFICVLSIAGLW